jgi:hypothetical protein
MRAFQRVFKLSVSELDFLNLNETALGNEKHCYKVLKLAFNKLFDRYNSSFVHINF